MKTATQWLRHALFAAIAAVLVPGSIGTTQAAENHVGAWGPISQMGTVTPYSAVWLVLGDPADPLVHDNLIYVNMDMQYNLPSYEQWESATWRPASSFPGQRFSASLLGTDEFTTPIEGRYIQLRNLTLDHADLDARNVQFRFSPFSVPAGNTSLTLNEGSLTGLNIPGFNPAASFTLNASGSTLLNNWTGNIFSHATMNVTPGATLTLDYCGDVHASSATSSMYFEHQDNVATVDGGTLRLQTSWVTFGSTFAERGHDSRMTFRNGATLDLVGEAPKLVTDTLDVSHSSLTTGPVATVTTRATLTLDTASVVLGSASEIHTPALVARGASTIDLPEKLGSVGAQAVTAGAVSIDPNALLTLKGMGVLETDFVTFGAPGAGQHYGALVVDDQATLMTAADGRILLPRGEAVTLQRQSATAYGRLLATHGGSIEYGTSKMAATGLVNHGGIQVNDAGSLLFFGDTAIDGADGVLWIDEDGVLGVGSNTALPASNHLATGNVIMLDNFSTLQLALDPTGRVNDQVRVHNTLRVAPLAHLKLSLANDKALPAGTKFVLVDYGSWTGLYVAGQKYFDGYPDNSQFALGLNTYQIRYADSGDAGYAGAITLTVVTGTPGVASLLPASQTLGGTVGVNVVPSAALVPSGFVGAVTYTINPPLPAALHLASATGIVSGIPTRAAVAIPYTITGTGATSGVATATLTLTVAKGSQTIAFGPPATPTYAPGASFNVSATATSGLPVTLSSLTPAVCTYAGGSTFDIVTAGTCIVAANQGGDGDYLAATQATQSIAIGKAVPPALVLTATPGAIAIGGTSTLATTGGAGTGAIGYSVNALCAVNGNTLTGLAAGTCTVVATQAGDVNYQATQSHPVAVSVGAGVTQVPLVLVATPDSLAIDGTSTLSTTGGSGSGAVTYAVIGGPCTVTGNVVRATAAGQCQLSATKAADGTYAAVTSSPLVVSISPKPAPTLILTTSAATIAIGVTSTLTTTGGIPGAAVTYAVSGPCTVTGNVLTGTGQGNCSVTARQAATGEYTGATSNIVTIAVWATGSPAAIPTLGLPALLLLSALLVLVVGWTRPSA